MGVRGNGGREIGGNGGVGRESGEDVLVEGIGIDQEGSLEDLGD
jgi:hypothetical protein